ncbi:MAG TPA: TonB-dependent receptor [Terriglobales bacterium]|nr:TonB-dependent receptor [Terriglobales bacterium]
MRVVPAVLLPASLLASVFAANLQIRVVDPNSAAVSGARVSVFPRGQSTPLQAVTTSGEGLASIEGLREGSYQLQVLAPGFSAYFAIVSVPQAASYTAALSLARVTETVVVSATRSPVPVEETGASVSTLETAQLTNMQPVSLSDAIRFLPGVVVSDAGQRGGLTSLFVRGGDSDYNKVVVDGVPVNEPGGTFDFGTVPLQGVDRIELLRGAQSTLYGSDAMTSVVTIFSRTGSSATPQLLLGADGGNFYTAHGYAALSGARGRFDYNAFLDQFNTEGQDVNGDYSNSLQGGNFGVRLRDGAFLRIRARHANSRTGVQGEWDFNGQVLYPPDSDQRARQNNLLASAQLSISGPSHWQNQFSGFEYSHRTLNEDTYVDPGRGCDVTTGNFLDCYFQDLANINVAGFTYQGDYTPRSWLETSLGYEFEDENGTFNSQFLTTDLDNRPIVGFDSTHGLRLNHNLFLQQRITRGRLSLIAGLRYVHNGSFGSWVVPRGAATFLLLHGGQLFSGTRLRFSYAQAIKEPSFEESFGITGLFPSDPNPNLKPEENRAYEAGLEQSLWAGKYLLSAIYFNNQFRNQIEFTTNPADFNGYFINLNRSFAQGAEVEFKGAVTHWLQLDTAYNYTSTQILEAPLCTPQNFCNPLFAAGQPLLRRPKHSGSLLVNYFGRRWGGDVGGSFVGRRPDSDFLGLGFDHTPSYALVNLGGWYDVRPQITVYANLENTLNRHYEEVVGYPALRLNFRAGLRFRIGGD